jgi:hypothetical protein
VTIGNALVLQLAVLPGRFGIYRFDPGERVPEIVLARPFGIAFIGGAVPSLGLSKAIPI